MPKVTSKLQLTVPKAIADHYGIRPGDELQWVPAGETIRVVPPGKASEEQTLSLERRLELFDHASQRQQRRDAALRRSGGLSKSPGRGWKREDLYRRGLSD